MLNVQDEVLANKPMYRIRDEQGNIIEENAEIELNTPVVQEGTAMNKLLFDKVNNEILLDGRYNKITQEGNRRFGNLFTGSSTASDGWYTNGKVRIKCEKVSYEDDTVSGFNVSANIFNGGGFGGVYGQASSVPTIDMGKSYSKSFNLMFDFGEPIKPINFTLGTWCKSTSAWSQSTVNAQSQVSNDGENWIDLMDIPFSSSAYRTIEFPSYYRYFRVTYSVPSINSEWHRGIAFGSANIKEWLVPASADSEHYDFSLDTNINEYDEGRKIDIEIPEDSEFDSNNVYLRVGNLPYKKVNGFGKAGGKLTLIYNEDTDSFDIDRGTLEYKTLITQARHESNTTALQVTSITIPSNIDNCYVIIKFNGKFGVFGHAITDKTDTRIEWHRLINKFFTMNEDGTSVLAKDTQVLLLESVGGNDSKYGIRLYAKISWDDSGLIITPILQPLNAAGNSTPDWTAYGTLSTTIIPIG